MTAAPFVALLLTLASPAPEGPPAGLAVHVGSTDGRVEIGLASRARLVHGLARDDAARDDARAAIRDQGLYGAVSVETWFAPPRLPYADRLVNRLVADLDALGALAPALEEIDRVMAPGGVARIRRDGAWSERRAARPEAMDVWTHYDHGADGNPVSSDTLVGPVTALRWYAGPPYTRAGSQREPGFRTAGGRVVYALKDHGIPGRAKRGALNHLVCRDAYNGVLLWRIPIAPDEYVPYRHELVMDADRICTSVAAAGPMVALDAATGKTVLAYEQGVRVEALGKDARNKPDLAGRHLVARLDRGRLYQACRSRIVALDAATGKRLWAHDAGGDRHVGLLVAGEGAVFAAIGRERTLPMRGTVAIRLGALVAFDRETGRERWRSDALDGTYLVRLVHHDGQLPVAGFTGKDRKGRGDTPMSGFGHPFTVTNVRASDGKTLWTQASAKSAGGHYAITFVRDGVAYVACESGFGYDLRTGEPVRSFHHRTFVNSCAETRATPKWILYGMSFGDAEGLLSPRAIARSTCDTGVFPANGLVYCSPPLCVCLDALAGYAAFAAEPPTEPVPKPKRLVGGPAPEGGEGPGPGDWPMYLGGPTRGAAVPAAVPASLRIAWTQPVSSKGNDAEVAAGPITAPTAANGRVVVAVPNAHRLEARSAETGARLWSFAAGGRFDTPPTLHGGLCLAGCRDGRVYALKAEDGTPVWSHLVAPTAKRIVSDGHVESPWPVRGSVMVHGGALYVTAGRHSAVDGGIVLAKLDPRTGRAAWRTAIASAVVEKTGKKEIPTYPNHGEEGRYYPRAAYLLVSDGERLHHFVETLEKDDTAGGRVAMLPTNGRWDKRVDTAGMPWLRPNLNGFASRRIEAIGRWDYDGVAYGAVRARAIAFTKDALYCIDGREAKGKKGKYGQLTRVPLRPDGLPAEDASWKVRTMHHDGKREHNNLVITSLVVAGKTIFLAGHEKEKEPSFVHAYATDDGQKLGQWMLPARPVRNGLIAASGRLFVSLESGALLCLAP